MSEQRVKSIAGALRAWTASSLFSQIDPRREANANRSLLTGDKAVHKAMELRKDDLNVGANTFLAGGGEMGELIRAKDWPKTPLGPVENWASYA